MNHRVTVETDESASHSRDILAQYIAEVAETPLLKIDEERNLFKRIAKGDKGARTHMIKANLRLVIKIAKSYEGLGLPVLDLISEGNIGLMKAVDRFKLGKGAKLSTYGSWWIKQSIKRALANQSRTIRIPVHMVDKIAQLRRAEMKWLEETGDEPTNEELAGVLGVSEKKIQAWKQASTKPASLDAPLGEEDENKFGDIVADGNMADPGEDLAETNTRELLTGLITRLDKREAVILTKRFGLDGKGPLTLEDVSKFFKLTRERIRQIEAKALKKLHKMMEKVEPSGKPYGGVTIQRKKPESSPSKNAAQMELSTKQRFRALPILSLWTPPHSLNGDCSWVCAFLAFAYGAEEKDVRESEKDLSLWVRCLVIYFLANELRREDEEIRPLFKSSDIPSIGRVCTYIEEICNRDQVIQRDVEGLRARIKSLCNHTAPR